MTDIVDSAGLDRTEYNLGVQACKDGSEVGLINSDSFIIGYALTYEAEQNATAMGAGNEHN